jgi:drug/metabolite transporter (DMT)-like permease
MAYESGFSAIDVVMNQYFYGWLILLILVVTGFFKGFPSRSSSSIPWTVTRVLRVFTTGASIALVSICYCFSLQSVPASISVILLFQFTWIGVIIQAFVERRMPSRRMIITVVILIVGTILAVDLAGNSVLLTVEGVAFGMLSALLYALYIFLLGHTESEMHPLIRSFVITSCSIILLFCILSPAYVISGTVFSGICVYVVILCLFGCALTMLLFSIGTPRISTGIATILSSSELPASIICAVLILSEVVSWVQLVGISLMFFGISYPYLGTGNASDRESVIS